MAELRVGEKNVRACKVRKGSRVKADRGSEASVDSQLNDESGKVPVRRIVRRRTGTERLGVEAEKSLKRISTELAAALGEKAISGDVASVRLLFQLAEKGKAEAARQPPEKVYPSLAEQWANEPEWVDPNEDY